MAVCPNCGKEVVEPEKTFITRLFHISAYKCPNCGIRFKEIR